MAIRRREFLLQSAGVAVSEVVATGLASRLSADPLGRAPGIQLYTVMVPLSKDFDGTLHRVREIGYEDVEMAGFFGKKPDEVKSALDKAGLQCISVHIFGNAFAETMEYATAIGARYVITSVLFPDRLKRAVQQLKLDVGASFAMLKDLTLDDYKAMADQLNHMGEQAQDAKLELGYHNHNVEFRPLGGGNGYDELLRLTDPNLVKLELDCGWMAAAGVNPASYISKYPNRYRLLHVKDFMPTEKPSFGMWPAEAPAPTELGRGHIDYKPIFRAASKAKIERYYVEQEPPFKDMPVFDAIKVDYDYLHKLS